ncbi:MAG: C-terminal binding protein [Chloroflexota bacterium]
MVDAKFAVLYVDAPAGWDPAIEREELAKVGAELKVASVKAEDAIIEAGRDADGFLVRSAKITRRVMESLPRLKVVGRTGIGVDAVDVDAATELGVAVCNTPGFCAQEVADHALMFLLASAKELQFHINLVRRGEWSQNHAKKMPAVRDLTLGLVAFGEIGREVAKRARPFGIRLLAYDPFVDQAAAEPFGVRMVPLATLLAESDYVSVHAPLGKHTFHLIGEPEIAQMKKTAYLLNTARGPVVDEQALLAALREGRIAGAALDVFEQEPVDPKNPLLNMENVLVTPHIAGSSRASSVEGKRRIAGAVATVLAGGWPRRDLYNKAVKESPNLRR